MVAWLGLIVLCGKQKSTLSQLAHAFVDSGDIEQLPILGDDILPFLPGSADNGGESKADI